jgi:hypothetical protein
VSVLAELLRALELAVFVEDGIDVGFVIGHSLVCHVLVSPNGGVIPAVEILPCVPRIVSKEDYLRSRVRGRPPRAGRQKTGHRPVGI